MPCADVKTIELLIERMRKDMRTGFGGLSKMAVSSIACILSDAIGAPLQWPSRLEGREAAGDRYPMSVDLQRAFDEGVKWAVERYGIENVQNVIDRKTGRPLEGGS